MPSIKTNRAQLARAKRNKSARSYMRSRVVKANDAITRGADEAETKAVLDEAIKTLDQAATKGIIHKNKAARGKSRLMANYHKAKQ